MRRTLLALAAVVALAHAATLEPPEQFAGFRIGSDRKLVRWDRIVEYMREAAAASPRIKVEELGKTTNGNPFLVVTISSPDTIANLAPYRERQHRLADPRGLSDSEAQRIVAQQKAVLLITCAIHASEIGSTQMALELVHRLATEDSPFIRRILDNVIFLLVPSLNPDGQIIVTDWYNKNLGTPYENSFLPELYHKYSGHDNNRDAFMNTQAESRLLNKLTFKDWFPVVYLDEHQMGSNGPRIFVPPFKNPINTNVDPSIWQYNGMLGYAMGAALHRKGYSGVINDAMYTSWWQGGFVMQVWWHNMVGLLTEVASVNIATPIQQLLARPGDPPRAPEPSREALMRRDPSLPLDPPRDTTPRNTYPRPWLGGKWTLRDIVDYELTATYGLLDAVAANRQALVQNFYDLNRKQIELGAKGAPYAYVIPKAQHDPPVAARMLQILDELGVEVHQATAAFEANGKQYAAGSHVILMAQPFRAFAKDMLEKQTYPPQRAADGSVERPYDVTGWTLPYQMGVDAVEIPKRFEATLERIRTIPIPPGRTPAAPASGYYISHNTNNASIVTNRLLKSGAQVFWTSDGSIYTTQSPEPYAAALGVDVKETSSTPGDLRRLHAPRVALFRSWQPVMDEGWTRWLLEQYEFPYSSLDPAGVKAGNLRSRFDAIILPEQQKDLTIRGLDTAWTLPQYRGGIGAEGVAALRQFVRDGGTLITIGNASLLPVEEFPLPLRSAFKDLKPGQFSCPGSILKIFVDPRHPSGFGMPETASAVFYNDVAFDPAPALGDAAVRVIARYPSNAVLQSGWIGGEEFIRDRIAAAEVTLGKGRVILLGFAAQNRAQPHGTFKLLFNSIHYAGAE